MASESLNKFLTDLKIGEIENLFWTNGSREVPSKLVDEDLLNKTVRVKINWNGRVSGTLKLKGIWNYAKYQDSYYFLDIVIPLDNNKQLFTYAIYRDEWAEFIKDNNKSIIGTLVKTNNTELLWEHLQTTSPTTANFGKTEIISLGRPHRFVHVKKGVREVIKPTSKTKVTSWVVTREAFEYWLKNMKGITGKGHPAWKILTEDKTAENYAFQLNNGSDGLIILNYLRMTEVNHWSFDIFTWLNEWLDAHGDHLNIAIVNNEEAAGIKGWLNTFKEEAEVSTVYCIEKAFGSGLLSSTVESNSYLEKLDLSGLTGIKLVPLNGETAKGTKNVLDFFPHTTPVTKLHEDMLYWSIHSAAYGYSNAIRVSDFWENQDGDKPYYTQPTVVGASGGTRAKNLFTPLCMTKLLRYSKMLKWTHTSTNNPLTLTLDSTGAFFTNNEKIWSLNLAWIPYLLVKRSDSIFAPKDWYVNDKKETEFVINYRKRQSASATLDDNATPVTIKHKIPLEVVRGDIVINSSSHASRGGGLNIPHGESFKGMMFIYPYIGWDSGGFIPTVIDNTNKTNTGFSYVPTIDGTQEAQPIEKLTIGDVAATEFIVGRLNVALVDTHTMTQQEFLGENNAELTNPANIFTGFKGFKEYQSLGVGQATVSDIATNITFWCFSPFFINFDRGTPKNYKFESLPTWARSDLKYYIKMLEVRLSWWEYFTRDSRTSPWVSKDGDYWYNRHWKYPMDEETGSPSYAKAQYQSYYTRGFTLLTGPITGSKAGTEKYFLKMPEDWGRMNSIYFHNSINQVWSALPKVVPSKRVGKYITWGKIDFNAAGNWYGHNWTWDLLGAKSSDKTSYLSDHVDDYSENNDRQTNGLAQTIYELYRRFAPELKPIWNDTKKGFYIDWPTEKDYQTGVQLFDLEGTNYYMVVNKRVNTAKPKIALIVKNSEDIKGLEGISLQTVDHKPITDILLAINQHNIIFLYGHVFAIQTKLTFHKDGDKVVPWTLSFTPYTTNIAGINDYYTYTFTGPMEYIEDRFTINKIQRSTSGNEVEMSRMLLEREQYDAQRKLDLIKVSADNLNNKTAMNSAIEDLGMQREEANSQWWASLAGGVIGAPQSGVSGALSGMGAGAALKDAKGMAGKLGAAAGPVLGALGAASALAGTISSAITGTHALANNAHKGIRDLAAREAQMGKQVEIAKNQADHTHKYAEIRTRREISRISGHRVDPGITDRNALEAFLKLTQRAEFHIVHSTPSEAMLERLESFHKEHGADILVPEYIFSSQLDLEENEDRIVQFSSIYNTNLTDVNLLRNMQGRLLNGIKIIWK